jgi:hypothetical protein
VAYENADFLTLKKMSKKAVLLIGGLTHTQKEWKAWSSKYILRVGIEARASDAPADDNSRSLSKAQGMNS